MTRHAPFPEAAIASAAGRVRHVFLRDLVVSASVGVWSHEKGRTQRVRINLDLAVEEPSGPLPDQLDAVVCYDRIAEAVRRLAGGEHVQLIETRAERIAQVALADPRILRARIRVEKLDVYPDAGSVGIEIERVR
ncbi:MAG: dihydroneopterin aldolase [Rhodospirillales bacterium]